MMPALPDTSPAPRELAVLALIANGATVRSAAHKLGIREGTARSYLHSLYARLGVSSQAQAVALLDDVRPGWRQV